MLMSLTDDVLICVFLSADEETQFVMVFTCRLWNRMFNRVKNQASGLLRSPQGSLRFIQWAVSVRCTWYPQALSVLVRGGNFDAVKWAAKKDLWDKLDVYAAQGGHENILKWISKRMCLTEDACGAAIKYGHLGIVQKMESCIPDNAEEIAAKGGQIHILAWLRKQDYRDLDNERISSGAAEKGHLKTVKWLYRKGYVCDEFTVEAAAAGGHLDVLKWLHKYRISPNKRAAVNAARGGHLHVLEWVLMLSPRLISLKSMAAAAQAGHFDILRWGLPHCQVNEHITTDVCNAAARGGHLDILQWLASQRHACDEVTFAIAAQNGHLPVVQWLHANGVPFDRRAATLAAEQKHEEITEWILGVAK